MRYRLLAAVCAFCSANVVSAMEYDCTFPRQGVNSWIRSHIIVAIDPGAGTATVFDSLINQVSGAPIPARVATDNDTRLTVQWELQDVRTRLGFAPRMKYSLSYQKASGRANVSATAPLLSDPTREPNMPGQYSARGSCTPR